MFGLWIKEKDATLNSLTIILVANHKRFGEVSNLVAFDLYWR